jgi:hypothetical protein
MRKFRILFIAAVTALTLSACATTPVEPETQVPDKPAVEAPIVNAADYSDGYGGYIFRVGGGTVWCTISESPGFVLCEHRDVDVNYEIPAAPPSCEGAWGYQARLWAFNPSEGLVSDWYCSSGLFSDPEGAYDLPSGSKIVVGDITCFAAETVARCDNTQGQYLALGAEVFGFGN